MSEISRGLLVPRQAVAEERSAGATGAAAARPGEVVTIRVPGTAAVAIVAAAIVATLFVLGLIATVLFVRDAVFFGDEQFHRLFYPDRELGVPATMSVLGLAACSVVLAVLSAVRPRTGHGFGLYWLVLTLGFAYLAVDEGAAVHEVMTAALNGLPITEEYAFLNRAWVIAGAIGSVVVGLLYIPFLRHLPRPYAVGMVVAGAMYVGGAVGFEMLSAVAHAESATVPYMVLMMTEETLEMAGIAMFLVVIWSLARQSPWRIESPAAEAHHLAEAPSRAGE